MHIVSALFIEHFGFRPDVSPSMIDIGGVHFSVAAPHAELPVTIDPHLLALIWCPPDERGEGIFEVVFRRGDEQLARNVLPFSVEPGKFTYRLVRGELELADYGQIIADCRIDRGDWHPVPLTLLPPG
jgi:hypothetical protein